MVDQAVRRIDPASLRTFRETFAGEIVQPGDASYDASRAVWNGMIDRRPAGIVRPTTASEVASALRFARAQGLEVAVRSGGHSLAGHSTCDDGVIIDLARMRGVAVDPVGRIARCNGGVLLAELDDAAQAVGLACTAGTVSHTGVAGLTLGGGMGRLQRKLGLAIDCLRAVDVVTADGRQLRASADEHADLFWGMRGAGPNFGIVTALEFDLSPIGPEISRGILSYPAARAHDVAAAFREYLPSAPDDVMASIVIGRALPAEDFPAEVAGQPILNLSLVFLGAEAVAERVLAPLLALGSPVTGSLGRTAYLASQHANDESLGWGRRVYTKSGFLGGLPDELVDALVEHVAAAPSGEAVFSIWAFGGAIGRVPDDATAFAGRTAPYWIGAEATWDDPAEDDAYRDWARAGIDLIEPHQVTGRYVNDVSEFDDNAMVRSVYGDAKYERLVALKRTWDPDNVFHLNQNIRP